jgi:hypothetical protein
MYLGTSCHVTGYETLQRSMRGCSETLQKSMRAIPSWKKLVVGLTSDCGSEAGATARCETNQQKRDRAPQAAARRPTHPARRGVGHSDIKPVGLAPARLVVGINGKRGSQRSHRVIKLLCGRESLGV